MWAQLGTMGETNHERVVIASGDQRSALLRAAAPPFAGTEDHVSLGTRSSLCSLA